MRIFGVFYIIVCFANVVFVILAITFVGSSGFWWSGFKSGEFFVIIIVDFVGYAMRVEGVCSLVS